MSFINSSTRFGRTVAFAVFAMLAFFLCGNSIAADSGRLIEAIDNSEIEMVRRLLEEGMDPNSADSHGFTGLHIVSRENGRQAMRIASLLLKYGADPNARSTDVQVTPLMLTDSARLVSLLIEHGADANARDARGNTPLMQRPTESIGAIRALLGAGADPNAENNWGRTPLSTVVRLDRMEVASLLIASGANLEPPVAEKRASMPLLHAAALAGNEVFFRKLIDKGWSPNTVNDLGQTPLHACITSWAGNTEISRADENIGRRLDRWNWVHNRSGRNAKFLKALLDVGTEVSLADDEGSTALHYAVAIGRNDFVDILIEAGADPNARDGQGRTPLDIAENQHGHLVEPLLTAAKPRVGYLALIGFFSAAAVALVLALWLWRNAQNSGAVADANRAISWRHALIAVLCLIVLAPVLLNMSSRVAFWYGNDHFVWPVYVWIEGPPLTPDNPTTYGYVVEVAGPFSSEEACESALAQLEQRALMPEGYPQDARITNVDCLTSRGPEKIWRTASLFSYAVIGAIAGLSFGGRMIWGLFSLVPVYIALYFNPLFGPWVELTYTVVYEDPIAL